MTTRRKPTLQRIVSGGQTGVDRGALDAAAAMGIEHGGWCPRGRLAEGGAVPRRYQLVATERSRDRERPERKVLDSDGTLILYRAVLVGGTELTRRLAVQHGKPHLLVDLAQPLDVSVIRQWLIAEEIEV